MSAGRTQRSYCSRSRSPWRGPLFNALEAAKRLEADGISVINAACIEPLDEELLLRSAGKTGHVVTVEDHSIAGGLGGGELGDAKRLYAKHGLDPA